MPFASVRKQAAVTWPGPQGLRRHQPLAAMEPACGVLGQQVIPDPPATIGPVTADEAGLDLCAENVVAACLGTGRPGVEATA